MGSPPDEPGREGAETRRQVEITRGFWMRRHEVTQGEWRALAGANPAYFAACGESCPIENIDFYAMLAYANAVSAAAGLPRCYELAPPGCDEAWGERRDVVHRRHLRRARVPRLSTSHRRRVGVRLSSGHRHRVLQRPDLAARLRSRPEPRRHRLVLRQRQRLVRGMRRSNGARRIALRRHAIRSAARRPTPGASTTWPATCGRTSGTGTRASRAGGVDPIGPDTGTHRVIRGGSWHNPPGDCRAARHNDADHGRASATTRVASAWSAPTSARSRARETR